MKTIIVLTLSLFIVACGFQPLYGSKSKASTVLDNIWIETIADASGVTLRNELIDRFYISGYPQNPAYILTITLRENIIDTDLQENDTTTRAQIISQASYTLTEKNGGRILLEEKVRSSNSYNILASQFTTNVTLENARKQGLRDLAEKIQTRLALYIQDK